MIASDQKEKQNISEKFIDKLYNLNFVSKDENGNLIEIPESGFLGLLATGYKGLVMLRKKRGTTHLYSKFTKGKKPVQQKRIRKTARKL